jgi:hypothetical protein
MRGLCYHYGVELHNFAPNYHYGVEVHNFAPNSISQASTFVGVCKGFFGVLVSWDLWLHLLRGELFMASGGKGKRRPVHVGGLTFALRSRGFNVYPPCNMTTNTLMWVLGNMAFGSVSHGRLGMPASGDGCDGILLSMW